MSLEYYFPPGYKPTKSQSETLLKVEKALECTDTIILSAPTGTGKSFIAKTLGNSTSDISPGKYDQIYDYSAFDMNHHGEYTNATILPPHGSYTLTITKALQDQYVQFFDCVSLKGKNNYMSTIEPTMDVEIESAIIPKKILTKHRKSHKCNYYNTRRDFLISKFGVTNYKMFLSIPNHVKQRDMLICDEASELEDELVSQSTCKIDYEMCKRAGFKITKLTSDSPVVVYSWLDDIMNQLQDQRTYLQSQLQKKTQWSPREQNRYKFINYLHSNLITCMNNFYTCDYVVEKNVNHVILTPLYIDTLSRNIFSSATKTVLMSATIVDHKKYAASLGIKDYQYIQVDSTFEPKMSPILVSKKYPLSRNTMDKFLPKIIDTINNILSKHAGDKGIIHTHTHTITQAVTDTINDDRLISRQPGVSNEKLIDIHKNSKEPTVLVSPSMNYGIDLKGDLAKFQIIVKLPYLPLTDKRIKKLFEMDKEWYENKMLNSLVQACGRATRSTDDQSITYILDGLAPKIITKCKHKLPDHFLQRFL